VEVLKKAEDESNNIDVDVLENNEGDKNENSKLTKEL